MPSTTLYLVRHGSARSDDADPSLSATGRQQAESVGKRLAPITFASTHSSPKRRAVETSRVLFDQGVRPASIVDDLIDDRTPFPTDLADAPIEYLDRLAAVPHDVRDTGAHRLRDAVRVLGAVGPSDQNVLAVTHAFVIGWFVRHALNAPDWRWIGLSPANCSITVIRVDGAGEHRLISYNDTGHLEHE